MKTEYEYIRFVKMEDKPKAKTPRWVCRNNKSNDELGIIKWFSSWRQYCYFATGPAVFSKGCLQDIISFISEATNERKRKPKTSVSSLS